MAITLTKTLQGTAYTNLYTITTPLSGISGLSNVTSAVFNFKTYQTSGHYTDMFSPLLVRDIVVTDTTVLTAYINAYVSNPTTAIQGIEQYIVGQPGFFSGGVVS